MMQTVIFNWSGPTASVEPPMPVPEPGGLALLGIGPLALGVARGKNELWRT